MRPGWKTTEFWMSLASQLLGVAAAVAGNNKYVQVAGLVLTALTTLGYSTSRGMAKMAAPAPSLLAPMPTPEQVAPPAP